MKYVYSVYDVVAQAYGPLNMWAHDAPAVRSFSDALVAEDSPWARHPTDYELRCLGEFADVVDGVDPVAIPLCGSAVRVVVTGSAVMATRAEGPKAVSNG